MNRVRAVLLWAVVAAFTLTPLAFSISSPLLEWRDPAYIVAGVAGVVALSLVLIQPLMITGWLPGLPVRRGRAFHRWVGSALIMSVVIHIVGLWITSPPDVIDVLLFRSPTPFSIWGVTAMWGMFVVAILVMFRSSIRMKPRSWLSIHRLLVVVIVIGSVIHAWLIMGTMEAISKSVLCISVVTVSLYVVARLTIQKPFK